MTAGGKPPPPLPPNPAKRGTPSLLALAFEVVALTKGGAGTPFGRVVPNAARSASHARTSALKERGGGGCGGFGKESAGRRMHGCGGVAETAGAAQAACRLSGLPGHTRPRGNHGAPWQEREARRETEMQARTQRAGKARHGADTNQQKQDEQPQLKTMCNAPIPLWHAPHKGRAHVSCYIADQGSVR